MLSKLLKHEFRATARVMLPVYVLLAVSTGLFCLSMRIDPTYELRALTVFRSLMGFIFGVTIIGTGIVTLALMVYRFYKNYMTDEGYLMFTLPVSTTQLLWSKLIVALVWSIVTALAVMAAALLTMVSEGILGGLLPDLRTIWSYLLSQLTTGQLVSFGVEFMVLIIISSLGSYLMFYAAISLGHSFANHKLLLSVVFYLAFSVGMQTIASFGGVFGIIAISEDGFFLDDPAIWVQRLALGGIGVALVIAVVFYVVTHLMLKKRRNLQ